MIKKSVRNFLCIALAVLFLPVFFSCSNHAEEKSVSSALDQIDILINQEQFKDAERELDKVEKKSYSSWIEIGIFKRYIKLNLLGKAEKTIVRAIKKNPKNIELNAVYAHFLLKNGRIEESLSVGKNLQGSRYGSVYSEAVFRNVLDKSKKTELEKIFLESEYFPVYYDAYVGTKNSAWLRNCALLRLAHGSYEKAAEIHPGSQNIIEANDGFFWSLVMYDAACFGESVNYGKVALALADSRTGKLKHFVSVPEISAVLQDSYICLGDSADAELIRRNFLDSIADSSGNFILSDYECAENDFLPPIFVNSAKWAIDSGNEERAVLLLTACVEDWPDYVPGLALYADFAYSSNLPQNTEFTQMQLRDNGLASLEMERYDRRPKIPVSDAVVRIDESLSRKKSPLLFVVRLDLKYKIDKSFTETEKTADIWKILEENAISPSVYPEILFVYALNFLLESKQLDEAWKLFYKCISAKYEIPCDNDFWTNVVKKINVFSSVDAEYAFYFSMLAGRNSDSVRLGEYCVFENSGNDEKKYVNVATSDSAAMNLAMIYNSIGRKNDALELYKKVNGRSSAKKIKSLAMYRMALIYLDSKDLKNARVCAEYSSSLDPKNAEAKLLVTKIKAGIK